MRVIIFFFHKQSYLTVKIRNGPIFRIDNKLIAIEGFDH